jgi:hypothetical protein
MRMIRVMGSSRMLTGAFYRTVGAGSQVRSYCGQFWRRAAVFHPEQKDVNKMTPAP